MRAGDEDRVTSRSLVSPPSFAWWDSDKFGGYSSRGRLQFCLDDSFHIVDADEDILWFEIGMNHAAGSMHIIETKKDLFGDLLDDMGRDTLRLVALDET